MIKRILVMILLITVNNVLGYDKLFEFKLKLQKQIKPKRDWKYLKIDDSFELEQKKINSFLGRMVVCIELTNNKFYIVDNNNHAILIFRKNGEFLKRYSTKGLGPGDFYFPHWIKFYKNNFFINNYSSLDVFDKNMKFIRRIKPFTLFRRFNIYKNHIYCSSIGEYRGIYPLIIKMNMNGKIINYFTDKTMDKFIIKKSRHSSSIINIENMIYYFPANWNQFYVFNENLDLIYKEKIKYKLFYEFKRWYRIAPKKPGFFWPSNMVKSVKTYNKRIFLLLNMPRLEIIEINKTGEILKHYYNDNYFRFMRWSDFVILKDSNKLIFYVLGKSIGVNDENKKLENNLYKLYTYE